MAEYTYEYGVREPASPTRAARFFVCDVNEKHSFTYTVRDDTMPKCQQRRSMRTMTNGKENDDIFYKFYLEQDDGKSRKGAENESHSFSCVSKLFIQIE